MSRVGRSRTWAPAAGLLLLLAAVPARAAEEVSARLVAPEGKITVGDSVLLKLTARHPPGTVFETPITSGLAGDASPPPFVVERVEPLETDPPAPDETVWALHIRPFKTGEITVPEIGLRYRRPSGAEEQTVSTAPLTFTVASVLEEGEKDPADIRGPWFLPIEMWRVILYALAALLAVAVAYFLWRRYRRKAPETAPETITPPVPREHPYDRAMRELEALLGSSYLSQGRIKEFHVVLSEILKRFLGDLHGFDALDRTTEEVLLSLSRSDGGAGIVEEAGRFLASCDLVKFAKHLAARGEIDATISAGRRLIETGKPVRGVEAA